MAMTRNSSNFDLFLILTYSLIFTKCRTLKFSESQLKSYIIHSVKERYRDALYGKYTFSNEVFVFLLLLLLLLLLFLFYFALFFCFTDFSKPSFHRSISILFDLHLSENHRKWETESKELISEKTESSLYIDV